MTVQREGHMTSPAASRELALDLPLIDFQAYELWADPVPDARDRSVWPALQEALTEASRRLLWDKLREAVEAAPGNPDQALMVVEAFWRTMQIRRGPNYERHMADAISSPLHPAQRQ